MGLLNDRWAELRRLGQDARWKAETLARVGNKLGIHKTIGWPGAKLLARDLARGRANASTLFRFQGVNDAPAMAAACASLAMGAGADLTLQTAEGVTVRDELQTIPTLIALARRARRVVTANLVMASSFITVLVLWDLFGHLPLPLGVAGHEGSTIIVALNGLRLLSNRCWRQAAAQ